MARPLTGCSYRAGFFRKDFGNLHRFQGLGPVAPNYVKKVLDSNGWSLGVWIRALLTGETV